MAGRGRGRGGSGLSLTHEQLQALGIARGENNAPTLAPPPVFPKIEAKPLPLPCDAATDYMLIVKEQFIEYLHDSPAYVTAKKKSDGVERYSDKYKILSQNAKHGNILDCVWQNMPNELRPQMQRVRSIARKRKLDDPNEIDKRLQTLEKKESMELSGEGEVNADAESAPARKPTAAASDDEELEEEHEQEEIDDGTDYANNYFDNGEDYDEEDDNLDDGPVY